eukprot:scaffold8602_cov277-Pinguiococcus_pyrenoidosus.AAC.1
MRSWASSAVVFCGSIRAGNGADMMPVSNHTFLLMFHMHRIPKYYPIKSETKQRWMSLRSEDFHSCSIPIGSRIHPYLCADQL